MLVAVSYIVDHMSVSESGAKGAGMHCSRLETGGEKKQQQLGNRREVGCLQAHSKKRTTTSPLTNLRSC